MAQTMDKETLVETIAMCERACNMCFDACLKEDDVKMMAECIRLDRECADICAITRSFAYREGAAFEDLLEVCAKSCEACAEECEKHADHADHCRECAEACRECAEACRSFVA